MKINVRKYQPVDRPSIVKCMEALQDYLVVIDQMKRTRRMPDYGKVFTQKLLEDIDKNKGVIYVAEYDGGIIGFSAGVLRTQAKEALLESVPAKAGRILELFVDPQFRGQNIGTKLMEKMEEYFRQAGRDVCWVEVFEPNVKAHRFYRKLGYQDRIIDMIKKL